MEKKYEDMLTAALNRVIENNRQIRPGTPMAELKVAIESAISALPALEFETFSKAVEDKKAVEELINEAPKIIGWDADNLVKWIDDLSKKIN